MTPGYSVLMAASVAFSTSTAFDASGELIFLDDAHQNGFDHLSSVNGTGATLVHGVVHSGDSSIRVLVNEFNGASWQSATTLSTVDDYSVLDFWLHNGLPGNAGPQDLALVLCNSYNVMVGRIDLVDVLGTPIPDDTWVDLRVPLQGLPDTGGASDPTRFNNITIRTYSDTNQYYFVDDVVLIGSDIFANGFDGDARNVAYVVPDVTTRERIAAGGRRRAGAWWLVAVSERTGDRQQRIRSGRNDATSGR